MNEFDRHQYKIEGFTVGGFETAPLGYRTKLVDWKVKDAFVGGDLVKRGTGGFGW